MNQSQLQGISELKDFIAAKSIKILDCSWFLPNQNRDAKAEFEQRHITGAQFFDIDAVCDPNTCLPHMLPSDSCFSGAVSQLGISNDDLVVVYDSTGLFSAARVWWMFKVFGHDAVRVLDGGLPAWIDAGGDVSVHTEAAIVGDFSATLQAAYVAEKADLMANCDSGEYTVLDARPKPRFLGQSPEPRPNLPSGHIPNSISLPFGDLINGGKLKTKEQLRKLFDELGITEEGRVITSCGSGVTAAIITLAMAQSGLGLKRLYDGAWAEWGSAEDTIILNRSTT